MFIMKKTTLLFAAIILFSTVLKLHGAEWVSIGKDRLGNELFYDHEVIIERSKDIMEVQMKGYILMQGEGREYKTETGQNQLLKGMKH